MIVSGVAYRIEGEDGEPEFDYDADEVSCRTGKHDSAVPMPFIRYFGIIDEGEVIDQNIRIHIRTLLYV